ncbi:MAG: TlpA family protein disulfide reductase [Gammaproteobacteria bacterium]
MPVWFRQVLYALMLLLCALVGLRVYLETMGPAPSSSVTTGAADSEQLTETLPTFTLNDSFGEPRSIDEWAGKPLLINFWGTWCAPCLREMPLLQALHSSQDDLQVIGIAIDRQDDVQRFMSENGITYPSLVGEADAIAVSEVFGVDALGLPFTVLVSSEGNILSVFIGEFGLQELETMASTMRELEAGGINLARAREQLEAL